MTIEFRILGPLEARRDGTPIRLGGHQQRALLALLLTRAGEAVPRSRLVDELWPAAPPASAVNVLQTYVSHLRRELPEGTIATRSPGWALELGVGELDLRRFETLVGEGRAALASGRPEEADDALVRALALWRGPALGDLAEAGLLRVEAARLEELRLAAREEHVEARLALGRHAELVGELEALCAEHPLRERLRAQLMLALYRSGRQSEALAVYRTGRAQLVEELGIAPGPALRELEAAILRQDPALEAPSRAVAVAAPSRSLLLLLLPGGDAGAALGLAAPLARQASQELVVVELVTDAGDLAEAARRANDARARLQAAGLGARVAAFTSQSPAADAARLAREADAPLLLAAAGGLPDEDGVLDPAVEALLADPVCDVALLLGSREAVEPPPGAPVLVPFGGAEHEWAAAELGAWLAAGENRPLLLAGVAEDAAGGRRDASRLLAGVALLVQQVVGVETEPALVPPGPDGVLRLAEGTRAAVVGVPDDWRTRGLGAARAALVRGARPPVLLTRGGLRPGGLAPPGSVTRFTWTLAEGDESR